MNTIPLHRYSASRRNLRSLLIIRSLTIAGLLALLWALSRVPASDAALLGMQVTVAVMVALTVISIVRLRHPWPVTDSEYFGQLCIEVAGLSSYLYFSGGANNPFVSYYLVPVVIAAALLPRAYTAALALLSLAAYSLLLFHYQPLPIFTPHSQHHGGGNSMNMHVIGMWINFLVSVALISWFVVNMATALRRQQEAAVQQREDTLRNDQVLAVAGLAAGTAHELGTPLSTMAVLLEDLEQTDTDTERRGDYQTLSEQVRRCKHILEKLTRTARLSDVGETRDIAITDYLAEVLQRWQVLRPDASHQLSCTGQGQPPQLQVDLTLDQALENLLNNAADACPTDIAVSLDWDDVAVCITIDDQGPGIAAEVLEQLGKPMQSESRKGLGLGLLLSHATVDRYGGRIALTNRAPRGCRVTLSLPRSRP